MKIAVVSDTHGRQKAVQKALAIIAEKKVRMILHCGDIDDADTVALFPSHTHFVWGNCDLDRQGLLHAINRTGATLHGAWGHLELGSLSIAFTHSDDRGLMQQLEMADAHDFLFYGHTHLAAERRVGRTRVVNPGALHRAAQKTFLILDVPTSTLERIVLPDV